MASITETRLNAYIAAEAAILQAQEVRGGDRSHRMADLDVVRKQIDVLTRQLNRENSRNGGLNYALADLSGEGRR
jgi:hypothetical protein